MGIITDKKGLEGNCCWYVHGSYHARWRAVILLSVHDELEAFRQTMHTIKRRLELLVNLPADKLEKALLQSTARELSTVQESHECSM